ncbi:MAG: energy-coupled thiamine transporter ThiT [Oribacterium parvum]|uniref:Proton-coupled thiamine transporter YuaJ n=2 Tax=Oribacterium parvum TaxID=1501329 RepID=G9WPW0_9FIRM|nr:energy-coupled thiamine transporter ThiT [Oribacterium parvum]EHL10393.1 hypothetical protein HMPREF9625_01393 [Oribacterium parvum ACB1]EJF12346.1 putative proton-coupled thiamine transporter YuaJ [Oribacterium parvum ACB8]MBF1283350.1 energy-coupled thiamine transporter ThiT [Oribacterium parvum]
MRKSTEKLAFSGVCIALSMVLGMVKLFSLPMGGSVTACSMLFATLPGFFFGTGYGLLSGFAYGLISFFLKPEFYSPAQFVVDYIFAFSALGISGFFSNKKNGLYIGYLAACLGRFIFAFLSGLLFFAAYAPEGMSPVWYSFAYNISYIGIEAAITIAVLFLPVVYRTIYRLKGKFRQNEEVNLIHS